MPRLVEMRKSEPRRPANTGYGIICMLLVLQSTVQLVISVVQRWKPLEQEQGFETLQEDTGSGDDWCQSEQRALCVQDLSRLTRLYYTVLAKTD